MAGNKNTGKFTNKYTNKYTQVNTSKTTSKKTSDVNTNYFSALALDVEEPELAPEAAPEPEPEPEAVEDDVPGVIVPGHFYTIYGSTALPTQAQRDARRKLWSFTHCHMVVVYKLYMKAGFETAIVCTVSIHIHQYLPFKFSC